MLAIHTKSEVQKCLKATFLDGSIFAKPQSTIFVIHKKRMFNRGFIIRSFVSSLAKEKLDPNIA